MTTNGEVRELLDKPHYQPAPDGYRPTSEYWFPHQRQWEVYDALNEALPGSRSLIGYGGAAGGGKTDQLAELAIDLALDCPGGRILVGRHHFQDLQTTTLERFDMLLPPEFLARKYDSHPVWRDVRRPHWPPGVYSRVYFRGIADASRRIGSEEYGWILIEEGHETRVRDILYLFSRLRHRPEQKWGMIVGFNPFPGWCVDWFMDGKLDPGRIAGLGSITFVRSRMSDNPGIDPNYEKYLRALYPPYLAQRLIDGVAGAVENAIYSQFERSFHVRDLPPELAGGVGVGGAIDGAIGVDWGRRHLWAAVAVLVDALHRRWVVETIVGEGGRLDDIKKATEYLKLKWNISRGRTDREPLDQVLGFKLTKPNREGRIGYTTALLNHFEGPVVPIAYQRAQYGPWPAPLPEPIPLSTRVTEGPLPIQTPGLIIVRNGPGNEELITEIQLYRRAEIETERQHFFEVYRVGEDRVASMEDAIEELEQPDSLPPVLDGNYQLSEPTGGKPATPDPMSWPEAQPGYEAPPPTPELRRPIPQQPGTTPTHRGGI